MNSTILIKESLNWLPISLPAVMVMSLHVFLFSIIMFMVHSRRWKWISCLCWYWKWDAHPQIISLVYDVSGFVQQSVTRIIGVWQVWKVSLIFIHNVDEHTQYPVLILSIESSIAFFQLHPSNYLGSRPFSLKFIHNADWHPQYPVLILSIELLRQ